MPGAARLIAEEEEARDSDAPPPKAEKIKLWMPHELDNRERAEGCVRGVADIEGKLRVSQCLNSLILLCSRLTPSGTSWNSVMQTLRGRLCRQSHKLWSVSWGIA